MHGVDKARSASCHFATCGVVVPYWLFRFSSSAVPGGFPSLTGTEETFATLLLRKSDLERFPGIRTALEAVEEVLGQHGQGRASNQARQPIFVPNDAWIRRKY